jgi:phosphate butyryltransferase
MDPELIRNFEELVTRASATPRCVVAVINPSNAETFAAIIDARNVVRSSFVLVGNRETIRNGLQTGGGEPSDVEIIHKPTLDEALRTAVGMARDGGADLLMKGSVDTSSMMKAVLRGESGLRTDRLISDVVILEYPRRDDNRLLMITDGGINLSPNLADKVELIRNAVEVAHALGNAVPKVAVLSATEFILPDLHSTVDAASLSKMNLRGQIKGCVVDGPLALDNALSPEAAAEKGIVSEVAGGAEILLAPGIESANMLAKGATYFAGLPLAHVLVGARVPILIPSRADKSRAKLLSIALGMVVSTYQRMLAEE